MPIILQAAARVILAMAGVASARKALADLGIPVFVTATKREVARQEIESISWSRLVRL